MVLWFYIGLFALELFWLVRSCIRKGRIWPVALCNLLSALSAAFGVWYFDNLPGYGFMPGMAFFPEFFYSLCAAAIFTVLALVSTLCWLLRGSK
jgi:hypothetical protein